MINDFIEQCQFDEDRGLLPKGHTEEMMKTMGIQSEEKELLAGEQSWNLNGGDL